MSLKTFTAEELADIGKGAARALLPNADSSSGSDLDVSARMVAAVAEGAQQQAQHVVRQIFPKTSDAESLLMHADRYATAKRPAAAALGKVQILATAGTATQPIDSVLTHADGTTYKTLAPVAMALPAWTGKTVVGGSGRRRIIVSPNTTGISNGDIATIGGEPRAIQEVLTDISAIDFFEPLGATPSGGVAITATRGAIVDVAADEEGAQGNKAIGDTLTLSSPATDVTAATRVIEMAGGGDEESDGELAIRIADYESTPASAGNPADIRRIAREVDGTRVADAIVFPSFRGMGSVDVFPVGVAGARKVSSAAALLAQAALEAAMPYHLDIAVAPLLYRATEDDIDITITTVPGYERDWISAGLTIAGGSTVSVVEVSGLIADLIEVGDRVLLTVKTGELWQTYQRTVDAIDVAGGNVTLDSPLPIAPVVGDPAMLPGGPLFEEVYAALVTLLESLGPSTKLSVGGDVLGYERHPMTAIAWDDTLRPSSIHAAVKNIPGVYDLAITTPAANVQPNPQEVIRRGKILIRFTEA